MVKPTELVSDLIDYIEEILSDSYYNDEVNENTIEYIRDQLEVLLEQLKPDSD